MAEERRAPVVIATDLTEHAERAIVRGYAYAQEIGAPCIVVHVVPDVLRHHPLVPSADENDAVLALELSRKAADLVTAQVSRVLRVSSKDYRVIVTFGDAEDEIVRIAEEANAPMIAIGAKPRQATERVLGHVAERVVRYAHTSVLVSRPGPHTGKLLVTTDFTEGAAHGLRFAAQRVEKGRAEVTLLHVMQVPAMAPLSPVMNTLGSAWVPPSKETIEALAQVGKTMLESIAQQYRFQHIEQVFGDPAETIMLRAAALDVDMIVMGSHGRTGLRRLVLGSTAETVVRASTHAVLVARGT